MSGWGSWFGGGNTAQKKKDSAKNAILQLRSTYDMLSKREKHLQNQMEEQDTLARKHLNSNNKAAAKAALRRKKAYEQNLEQTSAQMLTLDREISSIETANINKETLDALKTAGDAMKKIHSGLTLDVVDQRMEELNEQHVLGQEIAEAITQGAVGANAVDEDELDAELAELQQEQLDDKMLTTGSVPVGDSVSRLPNVSNKEPTRPQKAQEEDDMDKELERLQAEMAM